MGEVEPGRILRVLETFAAQPPGPPELRVCSAASKLLDAAGVGISLGASDDLLDRVLQTVGATGGGRDAEALQFALGAGASYTAHQPGWPVQVADLERDDTWPAFAAAAAGLGLRGVFAFPLRSGSVGLGALTLYRHVAGELTFAQHADALVIARFALNLLASVQAGRPADELDQVSIEDSSDSMEVHQASGVVSVQLEIPIGAALTVMRAHAFTEGSSLAEVAKRVIELRLKLAPLQD